MSIGDININNLSKLEGNYLKATVSSSTIFLYVNENWKQTISPRDCQFHRHIKNLNIDFNRELEL